MIRSIVNSGFVVCLLLISQTEPIQAASFLAANLKTSDLGYSPVTGLVYATVPNASVTNPNSVTPITPDTAALGAPIAVGFDPAQLAISSDGNNLFAVIGDRRAVQRYHIPTAALDQLFSVSGGPQFADIRAVPGRPNAVALHEAAPGFSPPAVATVVYENGVLLPHQVGNGLGVGGPDIFAIDPTDGSKAYGYQNTVSSFDNVPMVIGPLGIDTNGSSLLQGVLTGAIGPIAITGDHLFDNLGQIFSMSLGFQVGSFLGGGNFLLVPNDHRLYSVATSGSTQTIRAYSLDTLQLLGTDTVAGISGNTSSLTRFGANGLAFRTSNDQVVFVHTAVAVPEPSTLMLAISALVCNGFKRQQARSRRARSKLRRDVVAK
jgi:hypothetical protein